MSKALTLDKLENQVNQETFLGAWHTITQDQINQFADATLDHQWIHTDPERAKRESPFGETIAHGFLTLSLTPFLTEIVDPDKAPYPDADLVINYGLNKVRFPAPVPPGSRVRARVELMEVKDRKRFIQLVNKITVELEGSERPACIAELVVLLQFE